MQSTSKHTEVLSENITAVLGNCMDYMAELPDNLFDWGICDPNYGIGASRPSKKWAPTKQKNGNILMAPLNDYVHKDWDDAPPPPEYFDEIRRVTKNQIIFGANYYDTALPGGRLVWDKLNDNSDQYDCEIAYLSFTNRTDIVYYMWRGMIQGQKASSNVREAHRQQGNKQLNEKRFHPTQKPVLLYKYILDTYVPKGASILDSHAGSFSQAIAASICGNPFTGIERELDYYTQGVLRVKGYLNQQAFNLL